MGPTRPSGNTATTSSNKRISSLRKESESIGKQQRQEKQQQPQPQPQKQQPSLHDYLKRTKFFPPQQQKQQNEKQQQKDKEKEQQLRAKLNGSKILNGVVACIDVRTEDGDDVSQNFEQSLQSMGAKTRRTFSDSVTHLIFKNGSTATLKKALSKGVFIMNLLWISKCKREGRRLDEKDYIIEKPQGLVLTGTKRRKSMEPGKVRALAANAELEPSTSSSSEGSLNETSLLPSSLLSSSKELLLPSDRRRATLDLAERRKLNEAQRDFKRRRLQEELQGYEEDEEEGQAKTPRLSLPLNVESLANRHNLDKQRTVIPIHAPSEEMKEQIKARFSIGQLDDHPPTTNSKNNTGGSGNGAFTSSRLSLSSTSSSLSSSSIIPLKRKRRLTGSLLKPTAMSNNSSDTLSSSNDKNIPTTTTSSSSLPLSNKTPTIVFTSMTPASRKQCIAIIKRLGKFDIAIDVDDRTTHVLCGNDRRTKSVVLGLLKRAWVLKPEWVMDSKDNNYKDEKEYEIKCWSNMEKRQQSKLVFPNVIAKVELESEAETDAIKAIIESADGIKLAQEDKETNLVISNNRRISEPGKTVVSAHWLYDSIEQWKDLPKDKYIISKK